ncbi:MAG: hypothetical protein FWC95_06495 [Defluviitaleaceae bacterium]|nr:hypothetical protein [Defluviitaleaceae bacterium]
MYHYYFSMPKSDNPGTVFLPMKSSVNVPVIISCYAWDKEYWTNNMEEVLKKHVTKKLNTGMVTIKLTGGSDEDSTYKRMVWENDLAAIVSWVRAKRFAKNDKIGIFAYGAGAEAALPYADGVSDVAFLILVNAIKDELADEEIAVMLDKTAIPVLYLRGTGEAVVIQTQKQKAREVKVLQSSVTKSAFITFVGADNFMFNISDQVALEIERWMKLAEII